MLEDWPQEWYEDWAEQYARQPWTPFPEKTWEQADVELTAKKQEMEAKHG